MKVIAILLFGSLISFTANSNDMIDSLKTLIKDKDAEKAIAFIEEHPSVLSLTDDNGSSGLMLIAYSGLDKLFDKAVGLKKEFSFHEAIVCGKRDIVENWIRRKEDAVINKYSNDGFTPLSLATFFNQTDIAKFLITKGADPNLSAKNPSKVNALHSAVAKENIELCELFIEKGVDVNAIQMDGVTALHSAVHRNNLSMTKLLVKNGANISLKMKNGDTALLIAQREGHKTIETYLMSLD